MAMNDKCKMLNDKYMKLADLNQQIKTLDGLNDVFTEPGTQDNKPFMIDLFPEYSDILQQRIELKRTMMRDFTAANSIRTVNILKLRYMDGEQWKDIANNMGLTERRVFQIRDEALNCIYAKYYDHGVDDTTLKNCIHESLT